MLLLFRRFNFEEDDDDEEKWRKTDVNMVTDIGNFAGIRTLQALVY